MVAAGQLRNLGKFWEQVAQELPMALIQKVGFLYTAAAAVDIALILDALQPIRKSQPVVSDLSSLTQIGTATVTEKCQQISLAALRQMQA